MSSGTLQTPTSLLLARRDARERLRYVAHTGPLTATQQHEVAELATPTGSRASLTRPQPLPAAWIDRFDRPGPLSYVAVEPLLVAEVRVSRL